MIFNTTNIIFSKKILLGLTCICLACACSEQSENNNVSVNKSQTSISDKTDVKSDKDNALPITEKHNQSKKPESLQKNSPEYIKQEKHFESLHSKIASGTASFLEVREALTDRNVAALTNTMHALFSMRIHRHIHHLLYDMWNMEKDKYPELSWDLIAKAPTRIALASTINRIQINDIHNINDINEIHEYKDYIRSHKYDKHEFHRAQVVVALGFSGDPADVPYLQEMASSDNTYVVQSAITGLAFMNNVQARDALVNIWKDFRNDPRADLILNVLEKAYDWVPVKRNKS